MLKERLAAANGVAARLAEVERAIDHAIATAGGLLNHLPAAQNAAKVSPVVGNDAYGHLQATVGALFEARSGMVAFHHEMDNVKNRMGLRQFRVVGTGDAAKILEPSALNDEATAASKNTQAA